MKLILIRHGKTEANEKHLYCGSTDISLSESGIMELNELKNTMILPAVSGMRIITSGMKRCNETALILFGEAKPEINPMLCEMDFGDFEMRSYNEMKDDPEYIAWITGDNEANITPNGESGNIMTKRVIEALNSIINDNQDAVAVTHGGVIAAIMTYMFPSENKNRYEWQPKPGRGYNIDTEKKEYTII